MTTPAPSLAEMMEACAQDAVDHAKRAGVAELDYSVASLEPAEAALSKLHNEMPRGFLSKLLRKGPTVQEIEWVAKAYGGYIGEVIRRTHGGSWELNSEVTDQPTIALRVGEAVIFPPAKVYKRLMNGPEDSVWFYYQALRSDWPAPTPAATACIHRLHDSRRYP